MRGCVQADIPCVVIGSALLPREDNLKFVDPGAKDALRSFTGIPQTLQLAFQIQENRIQERGLGRVCLL